MKNAANRVREFRETRGISQTDLARRVGITRQSLHAIETGGYVPNTTIALRLGKVLNQPVEALFSLEADDAGREIRIAVGAPAGSKRLLLADVSGKLVGHPLEGARGYQEGFAAADLMLDRASGRMNFLTPPDELRRTALIAGCDPSLGILCQRLLQTDPSVRARWLPLASQAALDAAARGEAHVAGAHFSTTGGRDQTMTRARTALRGSGGLVLTYAAWEQGLMIAAGNPKKIKGVEDLARPGVRFLNREAGSGSRHLLDDLLRKQRVPEEEIRGYERVMPGHMAIARAIQSGSADAGIGLEAVARACGLDFIPLAEVRFDWVIPFEHLEHPAVAKMLEVLQSKAFRTELAMLPGYSARETGNKRAEIARAA